MARILIKKDFLQWSVGMEFEEGANSKPSSYEIIDGSRLFYIPKTHAQRIPYTSAPLKGSPKATLDDLLNGDPFPDDDDITSQAVAKPEPVVKPSLGDNQTWLTDYTDGKLPDSEMDHIITSYTDDDWDAESLPFIPDGDEFYVWNPNVLEALVLGKKIGDRVLLTGDPGTGKTSAHKQFAHILHQPFFRVNGKDGMEPASFLGSLGPDGRGGWMWSDGSLPMGMKRGFYFVIDEVFKLPAGIQMTMQTVYEKGGILVLDDRPGDMVDKMVYPHKEFTLVATDNVKGIGDNYDKSAATQVQDSSSLDRFGITCAVPYLPEHQEVEMLMRRYPDCQKDVVTKLVQVAGNVRRGYREDEIALTLSPRGLSACCAMMSEGLPARRAFNLSFEQKLADQVELDAVDEFCKTSNL